MQNLWEKNILYFSEDLKSRHAATINGKLKSESSGVILRSMRKQIREAEKINSETSLEPGSSILEGKLFSRFLNDISY